MNILRPRLILRVTLWLLGFGLGFVAWHFLNIKLLAYAFGLAGPFSMLCAAAVWGMRDKADATLSGEQQSLDVFLRTRRAASVIRKRSTLRAAGLGFCALLAISPSVSHQLIGVIYEWTVFIGAIALGESVYGYFLAEYWEQELRAYRDRQIADEKRNQEKNETLVAIKNAGPLIGHVGWSISEMPINKTY
jgi:hypothetical protein